MTLFFIFFYLTTVPKRERSDASSLVRRGVPFSAEVNVLDLIRKQNKTNHVLSFAEIDGKNVFSVGEISYFYYSILS